MVLKVLSETLTECVYCTGTKVGLSVGELSSGGKVLQKLLILAIYVYLKIGKDACVGSSNCKYCNQLTGEWNFPSTVSPLIDDECRHSKVLYFSLRISGLSQGRFDYCTDRSNTFSNRKTGNCPCVRVSTRIKPLSKTGKLFIFFFQLKN